MANFSRAFISKFFFIFSLQFIKIFSQNQQLINMIAEKEQAVISFAKSISEYFNNRCIWTGDCGTSYSACLSELGQVGVEDEFVCTGEAELDNCICPGMYMDFAKSVIRLPPGTDDGVNGNPTDKGIKESICYTSALDELFKAREIADPTMEWQGFGSWNGMFRIYPGRSQKTCGAYDPRIRSWYVSASSGPKDVMLILDNSLSMHNYKVPGTDKTRWQVAVDAAKGVLKTLTINDHVNVVVFSSVDGTYSIGRKIDGTGLNELLVRATKENIDYFTKRLDEKYNPQMTNYEKAFDVAFDILYRSIDSEITSDCEIAVIFLSDGAISEGVKAPNIYSHISNNNNFPGGKKSTIFVYTIGTGDSTHKAISKQIACDSDGIYQHIGDPTNLRTQMALFYDYYATGMAEDNTTMRTVWVEPYNFATDGKLGTSVSVPVYTFSTDPPTMIGVAGTGLSITQMEELVEETDEILQELITRSSHCPNLVLSACQKESIRARYGSECTSSCGELVDLNPEPCPAKDYPDVVWSNTDGSSMSFNDKTCCYCSLIPLRIAGAVVGSVVGVTCFVCIVAILLIGYVLFFVKKEWTNAKIGVMKEKWAKRKEGDTSFNELESQN